MLRNVFSVVGLVLVTTLSLAQEEVDVSQLYDNGKYSEYVSALNNSEDISENADKLYRRGVSYYHLGKYNQAITDLTASFALGKRSSNIYYYTGASLHMLGKYKEAAEFYKDYLKESNNKARKADVVERIKRCGYGIDHKLLSQKSYVENIGAPVNTEKDEINAFVSPVNASEYYFSSNRPEAVGGLRDLEGFVDLERGNYKFDMYKATLRNSNWSAVKPFPSSFNSSKSEFIQGLSSNGREVYYSKGYNEEHTELYKENLRKLEGEVAYPIDTPIKGPDGDKTLQLYGSKYIFFSSNREGGYGGYDLYCIEWQDSTWSEPKNLGPDINSPFNEVDPHLINDGETLYFSSDNTSSFGGYDVFSAKYNKGKNRWSKPENAGLPINSPGNDRYFKLSKDGQSAIFSSDRKGSLGGYDVHMAYFKSKVKEQKNRPAWNLDFMVEPVVQDTDEMIEQFVDQTGTPEVTVQQFVSEDVYYGDDENVLTKKNLLVIDKLIRTMSQFPNAQVLFVGNGVPEGRPEFDLYFSVKRAEKVAEYLQMKGIDASRIFVAGHGSNYPRVKIVNDEPSTTAKLNNRRVGIYLFANNEPIKFTKKMPFVKDVHKDPSYEVLRTKFDGLSYKVVFTTVSQMYKGDAFNKYKDVNLEKRLDSNAYNYTSGIVKDYRSAKRIKDQMRMNGFSNAKVVPYLNGVPLSYQAVFIKSDKYPNLKEYLQYELQQ